MVMDGTHNIYLVEELYNHGSQETVYAVSHIYDGIVSVWDDKDFAYQICEDLEYSN
jgi:hypothetical protein